MKLIFLGTGSAFTVGTDNYQSNMLLQSESNHNFLIDCGTDIRFSLYEQGFTAKDINAVFVSHLHADHVGGLEWLAFNTYFEKDLAKPILFIHEDLHVPLWENTLSGGLRSVVDVDAKLSTFFDVQVVADSFIWQDASFSTIKTKHALDNKTYIPSFALNIEYLRNNILLSLDTQFCDAYLQEHYQKADLIFHDCETCQQHTSVHAHFDELASLPKEIKQKIWLYDYNPGFRREPVGFKGYVEKGQVFDLGAS